MNWAIVHLLIGVAWGVIITLWIIRFVNPELFVKIMRGIIG
jgi:hypothetical protein